MCRELKRAAKFGEKSACLLGKKWMILSANFVETTPRSPVNFLTADLPVFSTNKIHTTIQLEDPSYGKTDLVAIQAARSAGFDGELWFEDRDASGGARLDRFAGDYDPKYLRDLPGGLRLDRGNPRHGEKRERMA